MQKKGTYKTYSEIESIRKYHRLNPNSIESILKYETESQNQPNLRREATYKLYKDCFPYLILYSLNYFSTNKE